MLPTFFFSAERITARRLLKRWPGGYAAALEDPDRILFTQSTFVAAPESLLHVRL